MNIPKEAIEKAIEGGWKPSKFRERFMYNTSYKRFSQSKTSSAAISSHEIALDPTFWQALGESLGWKEWTTTMLVYDELTWFHYAHKFTDLILQGKDTDEFWKELLVNDTTK